MLIYSLFCTQYPITVSLNSNDIGVHHWGHVLLFKRSWARDTVPCALEEGTRVAYSADVVHHPLSSYMVTMGEKLPEPNKQF